MKYFIFMDHRLARIKEDYIYEWFIDGEWIDDDKKTKSLMDAINGWGDYSFGDQDQIKEELAEELIQNGTITLMGDIGFGTIYGQPKIIQLSDWKKPTSTV
jgi:hypothetical protein